MTEPNTPVDRLGAGADQHDTADDQPPATPRWVKVLAVAVGLFLVLLVALLLRGGHGPGMHGLGALVQPARAMSVPGMATA